MGSVILWLSGLTGYVGLIFWIWGDGVYQKVGISIFGFVVLFALFTILEIKLDGDR